ncbi:pro-FMRFamide-related neuropeptide VF [Erpetoichthys calabaricus]|uniref:Uncharacterized protein n=1 Tax=Erpetoichthys calabaricus TaxID=27687 RepID=A0A8C4TPH6_ERPCA|nr:pro-FMRFamide-related neuropeptide VF [Erpetoichthys calabaricus]
MQCSTAYLLVTLVFSGLVFKNVPAQSTDGYLLSPDVILQNSNELPHSQTSEEALNKELRSLDLEEIKDIVQSSFSKSRSPILNKLSSSLANLPLRFGRASQPIANLPLRFGRELEKTERSPKAIVNLPQRFGRSTLLALSLLPEASHLPRTARSSRPYATLPQRFGRDPVGKKPSHFSVMLPLRFGRVPQLRSR